MTEATARRHPSFLGTSHAGNRDLYAIFGYPDIVSLEELYGMYCRNDIAHRIVRAFPQASWAKVPTVRDDRGSSPDPKKKEYSRFVASVDSYFRNRNLWRTLERADRLASLGRFGILVLGIADGELLSKPLRRGKYPLTYVTPYAEVDVRITKFDTNPRSPRCGMPEIYQVTRNPISLVTKGTTMSIRSFNVHYTRVIHISEVLDQDDTYGLPRLLPLYNRLKDLEKVVGGSAEAYWINSSRALSMIADGDSNLSDDEIEDLKTQADEFTHKLRKWLVGQGIKIESIGAEAQDPGEYIDRLVDLIAGATGVPKRILIGSEAGELASTQDDENWSKRIRERRETFVSPSILMPFVRVLVQIGEVTEPQGDFWCEWPHAGDVTPLDRSTIANNTSSAINTYATSIDAQAIVPVAEFREHVLGLPPTSEYANTEESLDELPADVDAAFTLPSSAALDVTALTDLLKAGADGSLPVESVATLIRLSAPSLSPEDVQALVAPLEEHREEAEKTRQEIEGTDVAPEDGEPTDDPEEGEDDPPTREAMEAKAPMYVYRKVLNSASLQKWATANNLGQLMSDLHVTICYSREPVSMDMIGRPMNQPVMVDAGNTRRLEFFGNKLVLTFAHDGLEYRHMELNRAGASHDHPSYRPHVTLAEFDQLPDIKEIPCYGGAIALGPEVFEPLSLD